jgi:ABC-type multidrug transport system fused ATPase/permease subunit
VYAVVWQHRLYVERCPVVSHHIESCVPVSCYITAMPTWTTLLCGAVMAAPMWFFDSTPVGRLVNRFSRDVYSVDESLPFMLNIFLAQSAGLFGTLAVIAYSTSGVFLVALPPLGLLYYKLQVDVARASLPRLCPRFGGRVLTSLGSLLRSHRRCVHHSHRHARFFTARRRCTARPVAS